MGTCGTGLSGGYSQKPGDPNNSVAITATPSFGGVDVYWDFPTVNPQGVSHYKLYRGTNGEFENAIEHTVLKGNLFYDQMKSATLITYFYWVAIVTMNGDEMEPVGPASASALPAVEEVLRNLTSQIDESHLAESLRSEIDRIDTVSAEIETETGNRLEELNAVGGRITELDDLVGETQDMIDRERLERIEENGAFVKQINQTYSDLNQSVIKQGEELTASFNNAIAMKLTEYEASADSEEARVKMKQEVLNAYQDNLTAQLENYETTTSAVLARNELTDALRSEMNDSMATQLAQYETAADAQEARATLRQGLVAERKDALAQALESYTTKADLTSATSELETTLTSSFEDTVTSALQAYETAATASEARGALKQGLQTQIDDNRAQAVDETTALTTKYETVVRDVRTMVAQMNHTPVWDSDMSDEADRGMWISDADSTISMSGEAYAGDSSAAMTTSATAPSAEGTPGGIHTVIDAINNFPGNKVRVSIYAKQDIAGSPAEFAAVYSSAVGSSGWQRFAPTAEWRKYTFQFDVPAAEGDRDDYLAIWPDTSGGGSILLVGSVTIDVIYSDLDLTEVTARIDEEAETRADQLGALTSELQTYTARLGQAESALQTEREIRASEDEARTSELTTAQSTLNDSIAQVETNMSTSIDALNGEVQSLGAEYTAKVGVDGLIGGFGIHNDGATVDAGFDVDRFWIGRTGDDKIKPFIVQDGVVYMNTAMIREASIQEGQIGNIGFGKIVDSEGNPITTVTGKLLAEHIDVTNLKVADAARFSGDVFSDNYVSGSRGWAMLQSGYVEFNEAMIRGNLEVQTITVNGESPFGAIQLNGGTGTTSRSQTRKYNQDGNRTTGYGRISGSYSLNKMAKGSRISITAYPRVSGNYSGVAGFTEHVNYGDNDTYNARRGAMKFEITSHLVVKIDGETVINHHEVISDVKHNGYGGDSFQKTVVDNKAGTGITYEHTYDEYKEGSRIEAEGYVKVYVSWYDQGGSINYDFRFDGGNVVTGDVFRLG